MDTDLSLIEIGEEDDCLVEDLLKDASKTTTSTYIPDLDLDMDASTIDFSCSPLQTDRSKHSIDRSRFQPPEVLKDKGELQKPCCSSPTYSNKNKENLHEHSLGSRSPSEDPQQIKRRKKRGGYNLRKSLAWNKAFFTEEGVLDRSELSRLSKHSVRSLSSVPEEGSTSLRKGSKVSADGLDLEAVKGDLFNESPKKFLNEDQKICDNSLPRTQSSAQEDAASVLQTSRKVHMIKGPTRIVSQGGGCPRPSGLSSQKRLPNLSALNGTVKDSKVPKRAVLKPESSAVSRTSKNNVVGAKSSTCNQKVPPVTIEKSVGLRGTSMITKKASDSTSSSFKTSVLRLGKNMTNLPKDKRLSTDLWPRQATKAKGTTIGLKMTPQPVLCADEHTASGESCSEVADSIPQNAHYISGNIPNAQIQPTKPSGLRMPSPSLRYFDQPKSSASQSIQSNGIQSSNLWESGIPNPRKLSQSNHIGEPKPLYALAETTRPTKGSTDTATVGANALSSTPMCLLPSTLTAASHPTLKPKVEPENLQVEAKASDCLSLCNQTNSQQNSHRVHDDVDEQGRKQEESKSHAHDKVDQILHDVNQVLELNDNPLLVCSTGSPEQFQKDNHLEKQEDSRNHAHDEVEQILHDVNQGLKLNDSLPLRTGSPEQCKKDNHLKQEDARNHAHDEVKQILHDVNQGLELNDNSLPLHTGSPEQFKKDNHLERQEDARNCAHDEVEQILHDVNQGLELNDSLPLRTGSPEQCKKDNHLKQEDARNHAHDEVKQILHDVNQGLELNDNSLPLQTGSPEQFKKDNHLERQEDARNCAHDEVEQILHVVNQELELNDNSLPLRTGSPEQFKKDNHLEKQDDARNHAHDEVEQILLNVNQGLELNDNPSLVCTGSPDQFQKNNHLENIIDSNLINDKFNGSESGNLHVPLLLNSQMQVKGMVGVHVVEHGHVEKVQLESLDTDMSIDTHDIIPNTLLGDDNANSGASTSMVHVECSRVGMHVKGAVGLHVVEQGHVEIQLESLYTDMPIDTHDIISNMLLGDDNANSGVSTSMVRVECSRVAHYVDGKSDELAELIHPCPDELEPIHHNHKIQVSDSILAEQSRPSGESHEDTCVGTNFVSPEIGCQMESFDVRSPVGSMMQLNEGFSRVDDMKKIQQAEDSQFEPSSNSSNSRDSISGIEFRDATNEGNTKCCSRTGEDVNEQAEEQLNVGKPCPNENEVYLQESYHRLEMNDSASLLQSTSSEELQKDNTLVLQSRSSEEPPKSNDHENIIHVGTEFTYPSGNLCESSHILSQLEPIMQEKEGDAGDDKKIEYPHVEDAPLECLEINLQLENHESPIDSPNRNTLEHSSQGTMGFESSLKLGEDQTAGAVSTYDLEVLSYSTEKLPLSVQTTSGNIPHGIEINESKSYTSPEKTETYLSESSGIPDGELQSELANGVLPTKSEPATIPAKRNSMENSNHDALTIKYKLNAVPFSDEWLAALEAAGEDILTLKTGAVQNSPPDKSVPEPGPWSPVKRKHQEIGPFDCTKCTNLPPPNLP